ncbi:MAG: exonuclease SbcCD subunit D C-terminal domain-containing protein [Dysgonamonadaceae bacterium]|jgi:exonuclease SbcD|nr:exonuclease SbcCD subunit D C-terminal domain-containing protein [Dysgonamonadaceae bacterium]
MKLLHTADWHLGQIFYEYDRKEEHALFLSKLKKKINELSIDVLLIAGDVFDSPNPSAASQKMFYRFLRETIDVNPLLQIVIIAGNHDSAARLEAPNPLLEEMNITVRGVVKKIAEGSIDYNHLLVPLKEKNETAAWCMAVPYLRQGDYPEAESYTEGVRKMYETLYEKIPDKTKPIVAMGHLQATGSEISENDRSERTVIGGLECVSPDSFPPEIAYTALGHLHRAQQVSGRKNVRYAGAPLPMSFAEKNNKQSITLIEIDGKDVKIECIEMEAPVKLLSIPKEAKLLPEVLEEIALLPEGEIAANSPYLEIKVLITEPEPLLRSHIEEALKNKSVRIARITAVTRGKSIKTKTTAYAELQTIHPLDMAIDIFRQNYGGEDMPIAMKKLLQKVIQEVE